MRIGLAQIDRPSVTSTATSRSSFTRCDGSRGRRAAPAGTGAGDLRIPTRGSLLSEDVLAACQRGIATVAEGCEVPGPVVLGGHSERTDQDRYNSPSHPRPTGRIEERRDEALLGARRAGLARAPSRQTTT